MVKDLTQKWIYVDDHCNALEKYLKKEKMETFIILVQI